MSQTIVALEVGTHLACALVGVFDENDHLEIVGLGTCRSEGVKKAEIVDPSAAVATMQVALKQAEDQAGIIANQVHLVYSCGDIQATIQHASVPVMSDNRVITDDEVDDVRKNARAIGIPLEREIVHSIPQHYYVDDQPGVINPRGMVGSRLELDMLILHGLTNRMENTVRVVSNCKPQIVTAGFGGLCSGLAVLGEEEKRRGALAIDLGAGTTDFVAYADGVPTFAGSIPVGGDHITSDISAGLNVSTPQAEAMKKTATSCLVDLSQRDTIMPLDEGGPSDRSISLNDLRLITHARMEETFEIVRKHLDKQDVLKRLSAGVFLSGGGSQLKDVNELASLVFKAPCQTGRLQNVSGVDDPAKLVEIAAPIGMLKNAWKEAKNDGDKKGGFWPFRRKSALV